MDQGLSSLSNFGIAIAVALLTNATDFGAFALAYATYTVVLGISNSFGSGVLVVRFSAAETADQRRAVSGAAGITLAVALLASISVVLISRVASGPVSSALLALAIVLPGLLFQDLWRFSFVTMGVPKRAVLNDLVWCSCLVIAIYSTIKWGQPHSLYHLVLAWGLAGTAAALFGLLQLRLRIDIQGIGRWLNAHKNLAPALLVDFLLIAGSSQLALYAINLFAGLEEVGRFRGALTLFGPLAVVLSAARLLAVPEIVRLRATSSHRIMPAARNFTIVLIGAATLASGLIALIPDSVGTRLLGSTWEASQSLLPLFGLLTVARAANVMPLVVIRALGATRRMLVARSFTAPLLVVGGAVGAYAAGAEGAALGLASAQLLGTLVWWRHMRKAYQEAEAPQ